MVPVAMTIAGSDPSGGAGLQADLKTFHQHGVYGTSIVTLLTVQNTIGVKAVEVLQPDFVIQQLEAVVQDIQPHAAKSGALGNADIIKAIAAKADLFNFPFVVDPVMVSKHGDSLIDDTATKAFRNQLLPHAFLVTPNMLEAAHLAQLEVTDTASMKEAAVAISKLGAKNVLIKGGHLPDYAMDILYICTVSFYFRSLTLSGANSLCRL